MNYQKKSNSQNLGFSIYAGEGVKNIPEVWQFLTGHHPCTKQRLGAGCGSLTRCRRPIHVRPLADSGSSPRCTAAGSRWCPSTGPSSTRVCSGACRRRSGKSPGRRNQRQVHGQCRIKVGATDAAALGPFEKQNEKTRKSGTFRSRFLWLSTISGKSLKPLPADIIF